MAQSNWEPFFAELSKVVLEYDNNSGPKNRKTFRDKAIQVFNETMTPIPKYGGDDRKLDDYDFIDPFTFFMSISLEQETKKKGRITGKSKATHEFCQKIKEIFNLDTSIKVPDNFSGLAKPNHDNRTFFWIDDSSETEYSTKYLDDSWKFFRCILDEDCDIDTLINYCIEFHIECKHVGKAKITSILHYLAPSKYIPFTSNMFSYLSNDSLLNLFQEQNINIELIGKTGGSHADVDKVKTAYQEYFKLCDFLKEYAQESGKSLVQFNAEADTKSISNNVNSDDTFDEDDDKDNQGVEEIAKSVDEIKINSETTRITGGQNIICYGIPGCGKSYKIDQKIDYKNNKKYIERVVFHPDYTYADFVGQILPKVDGDKVSYPFNPGPFTRILKIAKDNPDHKCYLIIEEINRGNAPAIFGDIFQLLDRDENGTSKYRIYNSDILNELNKKETIEETDLYLYSNLYIICSMNTSDQNVFTLDTAFKRRWKQYFIADNDGKNDKCPFFDNPFISESNEIISQITWGAFHDAINSQIANETSPYSSFEDKRLGTWFISKDELEITKFANKVLRYLWDDVRKTNSSIFNKNIHTFEEIYDDLLKFPNDADAFFEEILDDKLYAKMISGVNNGN